MTNRLKTLLPVAFMLGALALPFGATFADGDKAMADGTIRKVDSEQGKVTIKHGPIDNLQMPPMTMVFRMKDPTQLDGMAAGDTVKFHAIDEGGKMIIETIEKTD